MVIIKKKWHIENKIRHRDNVRRYRATHPDYVKKHNEQRKQKRLENKIKVIEHYSKGTMACICCGVTGIDFLTLDHINNDGADHRRKAKTGAGCDFYAWLLKTNYEDEAIQIMCYNCNCAKQTRGMCPHKLK